MVLPNPFHRGFVDLLSVPEKEDYHFRPFISAYTASILRRLVGGPAILVVKKKLFLCLPGVIQNHRTSKSDQSRISLLIHSLLHRTL